jgi:hemerythrin-like domain-containing protein
MSQAIDLLMEEHRAIEGVLDALDSYVAGIQYPMAVQRLAADDLNRMATEFEAFERDVMGEGKHHGLHHLAERLIAATGVADSSLHHD